ncbi:FAD-dependent oxidoreductase [Rhodococcus sp. DMU1]|uniref:oxidoreductase n=1 Tax=Rhodococcus sp. DMU1 TaxID=2722825 RepID=UPI00143E53F9|nr:FAD-dependent oxidoreductase [Rhodococcus sp. DMU1]QIX53875.1 FAD-dependent oxidoreductase [Rhodococcus sp. DMU1]
MYDKLFEPIRLGGVTVPNRIARAAHGAGLPWAEDDDDLVAFHAARAKGGVGLQFLAWGGIHPTSSAQFPFYDPSIRKGAERIAAGVHEHGAKIFVQLVHRGNQLPNPHGQLWSASAVVNPHTGLVPRPLTRGMIDEFISGYASAAAHCRDAGLDGVEIQAGHGYLVAQFLSAATNEREDEYGGSFENRLRFLREIIGAVRSEVGRDYPVGIRISADEKFEGGMGTAEASDIVSAVEEDLDFVDVSVGSYYAYHKLSGTMDEPLGYELPDSTVVTQRARIPTIVTGRIMTLADAEQIVTSGQADMVSMVRALLADPDLVNKSRAGREAEVRPCVGASQGCMGMTQAKGRLQCAVNVAVGRESVVPFEPDPAATPRSIFVVGGGPAGMEAARTAAMMGHSVELHELTDRLGGQIKIAGSAPHRSDMTVITQWLADELVRLGVKVRLRSPVDPDLVVAAEPDCVIVATGSTPRTDGFQANFPRRRIPGSNSKHVYSSWDVFGFGGRADVGSHAVVYDDGGRYEALSVAEALLEQGAAVTFLSAHGSLGAREEMPAATVAPIRERLMAANFTFVPHMGIDEITPVEVRATPLGTSRTMTFAADTVVLTGYRTPERELADYLTDECNLNVHVVGDANGGQTLQEAIHQAATLVRTL